MSEKKENEKSEMTPLEIVRRVYKNALPMEETFDRVYKVLDKNYELKPEDILYADCTCADDANAIQEPANVGKMFGPFKMGGLNGFPFTGAVGMGAYAHHVFDESGALLIYYAPHIGIGKHFDESGETGKIFRVGREAVSSSCGAAVAALGNLTKDNITHGNVSDTEFQFNTIEQIFLAGKDRILKAEDKLVEATDVMYEAIEERINQNVEKTNFADAGCKYVILLGGVLINGDGYDSFNDCRRFEVIDVKTGERENLLDALQS